MESLSMEGHGRLAVGPEWAGSWPCKDMGAALGVLQLRGALEQAQDVNAVFDALARAVQQLGFEQCAYGLRMPVPFTRPETLLVSNYDKGWQQRYRDAGYLDIDPTVAHGAHSTIPLIWSDEVFSPTPQLWSEARAFGLRVGWAQSCFDAEGAVGMLSLVRSNDALSRAEIVAREPCLYWLAHIAHQALSAALRRAVRASLSPLSEREREVLRWTADGKTSEDVALLLRISVNTVKFHVKRVNEKLQVPNKAAAVAKAGALRMLG